MSLKIFKVAIPNKNFLIKFILKKLNINYCYYNLPPLFSLKRELKYLDLRLKTESKAEPEKKLKSKFDCIRIVFFEENCGTRRGPQRKKPFSEKRI